MPQWIAIISFVFVGLSKPALRNFLPQTPSEQHLIRGQQLEAEGDLKKALLSYQQFIEEFPEDWRGPMLRGQVLFRLGDNDAAVDDFDRVVELSKVREPWLWQRGISQYYAGRFKACERQFEIHRTVNPNDVENAVWHFLCVARSEGVDKARSSLLPVGTDQRVPMAEVYKLFAGKMTYEEVVAAAGAGVLSKFYAALYVGLYLEVTGDRDVGYEFLETAANAGVGGYMGDVARIHVRHHRSHNN